MYLSEYQAKEILARYGVPVPEGGLARTPEEAEARARALSSEKVVVKAQILAGGRGLAGGVKFAATPSGVRDEAEAMLGQRLVTEQTGPAGDAPRPDGPGPAVPRSTQDPTDPPERDHAGGDRQ